MEFENGDKVIYTVLNFHGRNDEIEGKVYLFPAIAPRLWFVPRGGRMGDGEPVEKRELRPMER